jgi:uncharacterized protein (TIGR02597 family)
MKANKLALFSFGLSLLGAGAAIGQTATTEPVGFISLNIAGGGSVASPKLSLISATLTRPILYQGLITGISGTTITVSSTPAAPWAVGAFSGANGSHYVEIVSSAVPARTGTMADISSAPTTSSIVTVGDLSVNQAAIGDTIRIRKDLTIGELFGPTNSAGLLASDDPSTADEVLVYSAAASESYFYFTGAEGFPAGWYDSGFNLAPGQAQNVPIAPNQAVVVKRKAAGALTITSVGSVKTGNTLFPVVNGINVLGTVSAKGLTLATSGLKTGSDSTGVKASDDPSTADEVTIYNGAGSVSYFYFTGAEGFPAGWYDSGFNLAPGVADSVAIAAGTAFVVNRKGGAAFNWTLPSPTTF